LAAGVANVLRGVWLACVDEDGRPLPGIRGRAGACATLPGGHEFGIDSIEMQPGSSFEPHVHDGAHILYVVSGRGLVLLDGEELPLGPGDSLFIAAALPHAVTAPAACDEPLLFLAAGYPHKKLSAPDRMRGVRVKLRK
jgi:quercetin dioxygenase-like cupin family protein